MFLILKLFSVKNKLIKFLFFISVIFVFTSNCTYIPYPFPNEIQGNKAREMILETIINTEILIYSQYPNLITAESPYLNGLFTNMMFAEQELVDNFYVPALIKINEKKMYKKESVEACIEIIPVQSLLYAQQGISYGEILATVECDVEEASLLQLGKFELL